MFILFLFYGVNNYYYSHFLILIENMIQINITILKLRLKVKSQ